MTQFSSVAQSCPALCNPMDCSTPGFPGVLHYSWSLLKLMSIELMMPSNHLILLPLLLLLSIFPSIRVFSNELTIHIRWPKCWSFSISPSNEYSGLISFRIDWFDLLAVQGTLKSLLQPNRFRVTSQSETQCAYSLLTSFLLHSHDIPGTKLFLHSPFRIQEMKILKKKLMTKIRARKMMCLLEEYG